MPWLKKKSLPPNEPESIYNEMDEELIKSGSGLLAKSILVASGLAIIGGLIIGFSWHPGSVKQPQISANSQNVLPENQANGLLYVNLSAEQLNQLLSQLSLPITDLSTVITGQNIEVKGRTNSVVRAAVVVILVPQVQNHQLIVTVDDLTVAGIRMLPLVTDKLQNELNKNINTYVNQQLSGKINSVSLQPGTMRVGIEP